MTKLPVPVLLLALLMPASALAKPATGASGLQRALRTRLGKAPTSKVLADVVRRTRTLFREGGRDAQILETDRVISRESSGGRMSVQGEYSAAYRIAQTRRYDVVGAKLLPNGTLATRYTVRDSRGKLLAHHRLTLPLTRTARVELGRAARAQRQADGARLLKLRARRAR